MGLWQGQNRSFSSGEDLICQSESKDVNILQGFLDVLAASQYHVGATFSEMPKESQAKQNPDLHCLLTASRIQNASDWRLRRMPMKTVHAHLFKG